MGATMIQPLSSGKFYKPHYDTIPVKSASANISFHTNNSKIPNFELWHTCRKWAICTSGETYCTYFYSKWVVMCSSDIWRTTRRHTPEDHNINIHYSENSRITCQHNLMCKIQFQHCLKPITTLKHSLLLLEPKLCHMFCILTFRRQNFLLNFSTTCI